MAELTDDDYRKLLEFRDAIRRFLHRMEEHAGGIGMTPAQHQLLLAVRGHGRDKAPSITELSSHLLLRHHSMVELVNRAESADLVRRQPDPQDHRVMRVELTDHGKNLLQLLSADHMEELSNLIPRLRPFIEEELETSV